MEIFYNRLSAFAIHWQIGICREKRKAPNNTVIPNQSADWCGNPHRIPGSLSSYRLTFLHRFPEFIHEKMCPYPGDCHASVRYFIAMTGNLQNSNFTICLWKSIACITNYLSACFRARNPPDYPGQIHRPELQSCWMKLPSRQELDWFSQLRVLLFIMWGDTWWQNFAWNAITIIN